MNRTVIAVAAAATDASRSQVRAAPGCGTVQYSSRICTETAKPRMPVCATSRARFGTPTSWSKARYTAGVFTVGAQTRQASIATRARRVGLRGSRSRAGILYASAINATTATAGKKYLSTAVSPATEGRTGRAGSVGVFEGVRQLTQQRILPGAGAVGVDR